MKHLGYNTWLFKYVVFVIGGMFAGVAGVLFAPAAFTVVPQYLGSLTSATVMLMVIIGSARIFMGPVIGAAFVLFLQLIVNNWPPPWAPDGWQGIAARWELILGLTFVISVMLLPGGIGVYLDRVLLWLRFRSAPPDPQVNELPVVAEQNSRQTA
jgi:branched-chain amino acid transport system permease protein